MTVQNRDTGNNVVKVQISSPKSSDAVFSNVYSTSSYSQPLNFVSSDKQQKMEQQQQLLLKNSTAITSLSAAASATTTATGIKSCSSPVEIDRESLIINHVPLLQQQQHSSAAVAIQSKIDSPNSVIVKNEGKNLTQFASVSSEQVVAVTSRSTNTATSVLPLSSSTKFQLNTTPDMHHLQSSLNARGCDYRSGSSNLSPLHATSTAPHMLNTTSIQLEPKLHHNRQTSTSPARRRHSPVPPLFRHQSPHRRQSPLPAISPLPSQQSQQQPSSLPMPYHGHTPLASSIRTGSPTDQSLSRHVVVTPSSSPQSCSSNIYQMNVATVVSSHSCQTSSSVVPVPLPISLPVPLAGPTTCVTIPAKPKVSSPVPPQIYGKPTSGLPSELSPSSLSLCHSQESPTNASFNSKVLITRSPFQRLSQHQLPPNTSIAVTVTPPVSISASNCVPPPAHSGSTAVSVLGEFAKNTAKCCVSDVTADHNVVSKTTAWTDHAPVAQVQPLDLGFKERSKSGGHSVVVVSAAASEECDAVDVGVRVQIDVDVRDVTFHQARVDSGEVNEPSFVLERNISDSDSCSPPSQSFADEVSAASSTSMSMRTRTPCISPNTPVRTNPPISEGEKCNSPKSGTYRGHKLKKTWLQRHSGEDVSEERNTGALELATTTVVTDSHRIPSSTSSSIVPNINTEEKCKAHVLVVTESSNVASEHFIHDFPATTIILTAATVRKSENLPEFDSPNNSFGNIGSMTVSSVNAVRQSKVGCKKTKQSVSCCDNTVLPVGNGYPSSPDKPAFDVNSDESSAGSNTEAETKTTLLPKRVVAKLERKKQLDSRREQKEMVDQVVASTESPKRKKLQDSGSGSSTGASVGNGGGGSSTDSEKESASEKEADMFACYGSNDSGGGGSNSSSGNNSISKKTSSHCGGSEANTYGRDDRSDGSRKRGRKSKALTGAGENSGGGTDGDGKDTDSNFSEEPKEKKFRDESKGRKDPFRKPPISQLRKTGESFLQDGPCHEVAPKLAKCRECRWTLNQRSKSNSNIFCRFYAFRRLRYTKNGQLAIAGFSDPHVDAAPVSLFECCCGYPNYPLRLRFSNFFFFLCVC